MSEKSVDVALRAYTAFVSEPPDVETLHEVLGPDHILTTGWGVDSTEYHGVVGALAAIAEMSAIWDSQQQELEQLIDAGDRGVVALLRLRATGRASAIPVEVPWAMVCTLSNGRIVASHAFLSHDEALIAAGLEE